MTTWWVLAIKSFDTAKLRLAPVLDAAGRSRLARTMACRTIDLLRQTSPRRIGVVTAGSEVARIARARDCPVVAEIEAARPFWLDLQRRANAP